MDLNRLTQKTQEALHDAQTKASPYGHTDPSAGRTPAPRPRPPRRWGGGGGQP